jgi:hypothetical protein
MSSGQLNSLPYLEPNALVKRLWPSTATGANPACAARSYPRRDGPDGPVHSLELCERRGLMTQALRDRLSGRVRRDHEPSIAASLLANVGVAGLRPCQPSRREFLAAPGQPRDTRSTPTAIAASLAPMFPDVRQRMEGAGVEVAGAGNVMLFHVGPVRNSIRWSGSFWSLPPWTTTVSGERIWPAPPQSSTPSPTLMA